MAKKKSTDEDRMMAAATPASPRAKAHATAAPPLEPQPTLADQKAGLLVQIDELESALRFMGATHPQRQESERRLAQLKLLLEHVNKAGAT